ncbi:MAG: hypothetical protein ABW168_27765 [Sedimenticola sp.]
MDFMPNILWSFLDEFGGHLPILILPDIGLLLAVDRCTIEFIPAPLACGLVVHQQVIDVVTVVVRYILYLPVGMFPDGDIG